MEHPVLLYDGVCRFCNGVVQWVLRHDRRGVIHFAPLQGRYALEVLDRHPELKSIDSLIIVDPSGAVHTKSEAVLQIAHHLGGAWSLLRAGRLLPRRLRDLLYDLFARNRYRLFGKYESCLRPSPEAMSRFIDTV